MKLKCIGGPNHLEYQNVHKDCYNGDMVRLITFPKMPIVNAALDMKAADYVKIDYNFYIVDSLKLMEEGRVTATEFKFLRHKDITLSEAIRIALVY